MTSRKTLALATTLLLCAGVPAQTCETAHAQQKDVLGLAAEAGSFRTLVAAVQAAGLTEALSSKGPFTVFAPTDEAFAKLGKDTIRSLLRAENRDRLVAILTYHVVPGAYPAASVVEAESLPTLQGAKLAVRADDAGVRVGGAKVLRTDLRASNGVIHVVDRVILPPAKRPNLVEVAAKAGKFHTLLAAAKAAGLAEALAGDGPFTVFAPTDEAFAKLGKDTIRSLLQPESRARLAEILKLHVVPGKVTARAAVIAGKARTLQGATVEIDIRDGRLTVNGARVIGSDVDAGNGVIHVIDRVILPR